MYIPRRLCISRRAQELAILFQSIRQKVEREKRGPVVKSPRPKCWPNEIAACTGGRLSVLCNEHRRTIARLLIDRIPALRK
jgi:hypothetical protein